jgi:hypothetical protein
MTQAARIAISWPKRKPTCSVVLSRGAQITTPLLHPCRNLRCRRGECTYKMLLLQLRCPRFHLQLGRIQTKDIPPPGHTSNTNAFQRTALHPSPVLQATLPPHELHLPPLMPLQARHWLPPWRANPWAGAPPGRRLRYRRARRRCRLRCCMSRG